MPEPHNDWQQFTRLRIDSKKLSRRARRAQSATMRHANRFILRRLESIRASRRAILGWLIGVGVIIIAIVAQSLLLDRNYITSTSDQGGTYAEASLGPIDTLNPLYAKSSAELSTAKLLFSSLYDYDETGHLRADIAKEMTVDPSGQVYTIALRKDALWHDGKPVTAKDVVFTINLMKNSEARTQMAANWRDITAVALNTYTVQFKLPAVYASFPYALTFAIVPEHILAKIEPSLIRESAFSRSPVGSGPFSFSLLQAASAVNQQKVAHLVANSDYYRGRPLLNRFEVHAYQDEATIAKALAVNEVNSAVDIDPAKFENLNMQSYSVKTLPAYRGLYTIFNIRDPLLADINIRRALQIGTDTEAIRKNVPGAEKLELPFVGMQVKGTMPPKPPLNIEEARKLLDQAGWKMAGKHRAKDGKKLTITITTTKNSQYESVVTALQSQWEKLGIDVRKRIVDINNPGTRFIQETLQPRNYQVLLYELLIGADPDVYAYWHSSQASVNGYNFANYSNSTADSNLSTARSRLDETLRDAKYVAFARQWLSDAPAIGLYQSAEMYVTNKKTTSIADGARLITPADRYANVIYWSVGTKSVYKTP